MIDYTIYSRSTEPAYCWSVTHNVKFTLLIGQYINVLDFFNKHNLSFLLTDEINFSVIPSYLIGKGSARNLAEYLKLNEDNYKLTLSFLSYFISTICDFRYSINDKKLNYTYQETNKKSWQNVFITVRGSGIYTTDVTSIIPVSTTTTIPTTTTTTTTEEPKTSGTSGTNGADGVIGTSGADGTSGTSGTDGTSGADGVIGTSGSSGTSGIGTSGTSGIGTSGTSGIGTSGTDGSSGIDGTSGYLPQLGLDGQIVYRDQAAQYWYNTNSGLTFAEQTLKVTGYGDIFQCFSYDSYSGITKNILTVKDDDSSELLTVFSDNNETLFQVTNDGYILMNCKIISSSDKLSYVTFGSFEITHFPKVSGTTAFIDYYISSVTTSDSIQAGNIIAVWNNSAVTYSGTTSIELNVPVSDASISVLMVDDDIKIYFNVISGIWNCKISLKIM